MMIGGADMILQGATKSQDADLLVRGIRSEWPHAMIQGVDEDEALPIRTFPLPVVGPTELIVYRDGASYQSWKLDGATADNQDAMIHLIVATDSVTLVVDAHDSALAVLARELLESVQRNRIGAAPLRTQSFEQRASL